MQPLRGITVSAVAGNRLARRAGARPAAPPASADWDWRLDPVPAPGQHPEPVLRELGFGTADLDLLRAEGVIAPTKQP